MSEMEHEEWTAHPKAAITLPVTRVAGAIWRTMVTRYEGKVLYSKLWNFWVRATAQATIDNRVLFRDYEAANADTNALLADVGFPWGKAETDQEVWERMGMVWNWLRAHVKYDGVAYGTLSSVPGTWPSIRDYARYYATHGHLVWAACFSKAHLFVTLLGRMVYPRFRFGIAEAHHTENGAPPTATHVYAGVYVNNRWYYLDPTAIPARPFPDYAHKASIGILASVDYEHPHSFLPVPLSGFNGVPFLPG